MNLFVIILPGDNLYQQNLLAEALVLRDLHDLISNTDFVITKAVKDGQIILFDKSSYVDTVDQLLEVSSYIEVKKDSQ